MITPLSRIRRLVFVQRLTRAVLRAAWLGGAGYLLGWGINMLVRPIFDPRALILLAVLFALPSLVLALAPISFASLAWALDRRLGLLEQVSAAWQAANQGEQDSLTSELAADVAGLLPIQQARILRQGWFLQRGIVSLLLIATLAGAVLWERTATAAFSLPDTSSLNLPPIPDEKTAENVFPSGIPGLIGDPGQKSADAEDPNNPGAGQGQFSLDDIGALQGILNNLGADLSEQPETFDAGQALQQGNLDGGAQAVEQLADQVDLLSEAARNNLQQSLQRAADEAKEEGQDGLADDLEKAASSIDSLDPDTPITADALDQLADDLRDLANLVASAGSDENAQSVEDGEQQTGGQGGGEGAGTGSSGQVAGQQEPFTRFEDEGETIDLEGGDDPSGLLEQGAPSGEGGVVSGGGAVDGVSPAGSITNGVITPYHYSWDWRYVVSEYFTPR